jgi:predicted glycoside hydrolase/deacetylase ChbG (UPF0249 family)
MTQGERAFPRDPDATVVLRDISVCLDDFGLHDGVNRAAIELASLGRLGAISCLVDGPAWRAGLPELRTAREAVEVGLHLNLTEGLNGHGLAEPLGRLVRRAYCGQLEARTISDEIRRQLDAFESSLGRQPDFIDGHQHVHQLPVIRDALLATLGERPWISKPWLRSTRVRHGPAGAALPLSARFKARVVETLGAAPLARLASRQGFPQNQRFLGVYDFAGSETDYLHHLDAWLATAGDGDLLVCHAAAASPAVDPLLAAREREYRVLRGDGFAALLARHGVRIHPLRPRRRAGP